MRLYKFIRTIYSQPLLHQGLCLAGTLRNVPPKTDNNMMAVPDGASCYICLDEGCDDEGKPLVRDCSCRGSTGFAHLSCIVEYAKQKSQQDATPPTTKTFLAP
jgi:hypothetical protein